MKGGTSYENSTAALTSYVIISLLESNIGLSNSLKTNAKYCIKGNHQPDKYTLAISTYALYLLNSHEEATKSLERLLHVATKNGNSMWWSTPGSSSVNIEMTAYGLMSLLYSNTTTNLAHARNVVRWLISQRSTKGSFTTTQVINKIILFLNVYIFSYLKTTYMNYMKFIYCKDTVVALDALSRYASVVLRKTPNVHLDISTDQEKYSVKISSSDKLKTKQIDLKNIAESITIKATGKGCVIAQVSKIRGLR